MSAPSRLGNPALEVMKVGFIGLEHMGAGMAANLLRAGHEVTAYNARPAKTVR